MAGLRLWTADAPGTMDWWYMGACAGEDTELFFHPRNERRGAKERREEAAKAICAACGVRQQCGDWALRRGERFGVYGGMTEEERRRLPKGQGELARLAVQNTQPEHEVAEGVANL